MKKFIIDTATETTLNSIVVDPNNLPVLPVGQEYRDTGGNIGQSWNGSEWVYPPKRLAEDARRRRDKSLEKYVDDTASNVLRWAALDADAQEALSAYRQALLDVPQQSGFPNEINWPTLEVSP